MTIGSVDSGQNLYAASAQKPGGQFRQDIDALSQALQSGDLSGAQSAFATLQQLRPGNQLAQASSADPTKKPGNDTLQNDMAAVGKALQSGDLKGARDAFNKMQEDARAVRKSHHGHHGMMLPEDPNDNTADPTALTPATDDGSNDVTSGGIINLSA